jgi:hypothetical protein
MTGAQKKTVWGCEKTGNKKRESETQRGAWNESNLASETRLSE